MNDTDLAKSEANFAALTSISFIEMVLPVDRRAARRRQRLRAKDRLEGAVRPDPRCGVTHFCGAPIVNAMQVNAPEALKAGIAQLVKAMVAGAAPPASVIEGMERMGFELTTSTS